MQTIIFYAIVEIIAIALFALANKWREKRKEITFFKKYKVNVKMCILPLVLSFLVLFSLIALRDETVGTDYRTYIDAYNKIADGTLNERESSWLGIGFQWTSKLFSLVFGNNYVIYFATLGFFTLFLFYKAFWENSKMPAFSLFVLISFCLYYQMFNQFRQMFAIAMGLYAIKYIKDRKIIPYIICILIATSFHTSAIILLPFYFIANLKLGKNLFIAYGVLAVVAFFSFDILKAVLQNTYYGQIYFGSNYDIGGKTSSIFNLVFRLGLLGACLVFYPKMIKADEKNKILYHMAIICTILQIITVRSYIFGRLTTYFFIFYCLLIPEIIDTVFKGKKWVIVASVIILCMYHGIYFTSSSAEQSGYTHYQFLMQEVKEEVKE